METNYQNKTLYGLLKRSRSVLLVAHRGPDGDTVGAVTALLRWCDREGTAATPFCIDPLPAQFMFLYGAERFVNDRSVVVSGGHDLVVVCDCGDLKMTGLEEELQSVSRQGIVVVNIDHHATNTGFGQLNMVDPSASSVCEQVYRFLAALGAEIDGELATSILTGILNDTDGFSNSATSGASVEVSSDLLRRGARLHEITRNVVRNKSVDSLHLWGVVLSRLKYDRELGVASTAILADDLAADGLTEEHVAGVSNFLNGVLNARVIMVLREMPDGQVRGSLRSIDDRVDVSRVARRMGGGGHRKAAGFSTAGRLIETEHGWWVEQ